MVESAKGGLEEECGEDGETDDGVVVMDLCTWWISIIQFPSQRCAAEHEYQRWQSQFCRRIGDIHAQAHTRQGHRVGEHLNARMDIYHSLEMAQADEERASGEENDKCQAHDGAVCYGSIVHAVKERNNAGWDRRLSTISSTITGSLGAREGSCRLVSITHLTARKAILSAIAAARAESFMLSRGRVICLGVEWPNVWGVGCQDVWASYQLLIEAWILIEAWNGRDTAGFPAQAASYIFGPCCMRAGLSAYRHEDSWGWMVEGAGSGGRIAVCMRLDTYVAVVGTRNRATVRTQTVMTSV